MLFRQNYFCGNTDSSGAFGNIAKNNSSSTNLRTPVNNNIPEKNGIGADGHVVFDSRHPPPKSAYGDMLIKLNILSDYRPFRNNTSQTVVLKQATITYLGMATDMASKEQLCQMPKYARYRPKNPRALSAGVSNFV